MTVVYTTETVQAAVLNLLPTLSSEKDYQDAIALMDWLIAEVAGDENHPLTPTLQSLAEACWHYVETAPKETINLSMANLP